MEPEATAPITAPTKDDKKQNGNGLKIGLIVMAILTVCGIGFGVYELLNNNSKAEQIKELQAKIAQLEETSPTGEMLPAEPMGTMMLSITESSWSGWDENYEPEEETESYRVELNKTYTIGRSLSFEITEINENSITIHTSKVFSDSETGIDLSTDKQDFIIEMGESIELTTPTMDAGNIYTLELLRTKC